MIKKTEDEIIKNWNSDSTEESLIMVSIACVAYNHEYCIAQALDGFLMQETNFPFEIIIHDDVSTDSTVEIIKAYKEKFPNIIKPIYQSENQFSQGISPMSFIFPKVQGRYMAFCDGDDYWTETKKLQIQVENMENHPSLDMCFHPTYKLIGSKKSGVLAKHSQENKIFTPEEILLGGGEFCPTASLLFRSSLISNFPEWATNMIPGDYPIQIMTSARGGALYLSKCMSAYRVGESSAWSSFSVANSEKQKEHLLSFHKMLTKMNDHFNNRFKKEMNQLIYESSFAFIKRRAIDIAVRDEIFNKYREIFSKKQKILWYLLYRNKDLHDGLAKIKKMEFIK